MAFGAMEILILVFFSAGGNDLVSVIQPEDYFKTRNIPMTVQKMTELAGQDPINGKKQVQQLLALRWLAANASKVKKAESFPQIKKQIDDIASGKKAQDLQGFAAEYAKRAAAALGSKVEAPVAKVPPNSVRDDAVRWFPKDTTFVAAVDFRKGAAADNKQLQQFLNGFLGMLPGNAKERMYTQLEQIGNIRIDRISIGLSNDPNLGQLRIMMRVTGKGNHKRLVDLFRNLPGNPNVKQIKAFRGRKITQIVPNANRPPVVVLVGDGDLIVAGYERNQGDHESIAKQALAVRRGAADSALKGNLAAKLKKISENAAGMAVGRLPDQMRQGFMQGPNSFSVFPENIVVELAQKGKTYQITLKSEMANAQDAKTFIKDVERLKGMAIAALQNPPPLPPQLPVPANFFKDLSDTVKSINFKATGKSLSGQMKLNANMANAGLLMPFWFVAAVQVQAAPLPPPQARPVPNRRPIRLKKAG